MQRRPLPAIAYRQHWQKSMRPMPLDTHAIRGPWLKPIHTIPSDAIAKIYSRAAMRSKTAAAGGACTESRPGKLM